jgi:tRNA(Ile)-lysidine synthase
MRPVTKDGIIRPLLQVTRSQVRAWATQQAIVWREDCSNAYDGFARNLLRNKVLPDLAGQFNPNLEGILAGTAEVAAAEEDYWNDQIASLYPGIVRKCDLGLVIQTEALMGSHVAVQRRVIRHALGDIRGDLRSVDHQHVDAILEICRSAHGHDRVLIPGVDAIRSFGVLLLARAGEVNSGQRNYSIELTWNKRLELPFGAGEIELSTLNSIQENCVNFKKESQFPIPIEVADFDYNVLSATNLQVRNWRPGDGMLRPGHQKPEKVKSLFQQYQVLLWKRRHWPVAVLDDNIFWARKFGGAFPYLAKPGTVPVARLCYRPGDEAGEL